MSRLLAYFKEPLPGILWTGLEHSEKALVQKAVYMSFSSSN